MKIINSCVEPENAVKLIRNTAAALAAKEG